MITSDHDLSFQEDQKTIMLTDHVILPATKVKWKMLIIDDDKDVHTVTNLALQHFTFDDKGIDIFSAYSLAEGKKYLSNNMDIAVILLHVTMETDDLRLQLVHYIRNKLNNQLARIILLTEPGQAPAQKIIDKYDISDYKDKCELTTSKLYTTLATTLRSFRDMSLIVSLNQEVEDTQKEILCTLGEVAEARSQETGFHIKRVAEIAKILALGYGLPLDVAERLRMAAPIHDVGKLAIPDAILNKPGKLTPTEFSLMKTHSPIGYEMFKNSTRSILKLGALIALQHHERYDGTGYPYGLIGKNIHIFGRIVALADVFDALNSVRPYKKTWPLQETLAYIRQERGAHFDPRLVDVFMDNLDDIMLISNRLADV